MISVFQMLNTNPFNNHQRLTEDLQASFKVFFSPEMESIMGVKQLEQVYENETMYVKLIIFPFLQSCNFSIL